MKRNTQPVLPAIFAIAIFACAPAHAQISAQTYRATESRNGNVLLDFAPNVQTTGGSTTKAMTIHLALKAIQLGKMSLKDPLTISTNSTTFACRCWASAGQDSLAHNLSGGEVFTVDDAIYGTDMSAVEPTVSLAEYVANVWFNGVKATSGTNTFASNVLIIQFIGLMNNEAANLGMIQTNYTTVFGGALELTSPADMIALWTTAAKDPQFTAHTGFRQHKGTIQAVKNGMFQFQNYELDKGYGYYPNVNGDKNGGFGNTVCCFVSQATRGGRTVVGALLGSGDGFGDITQVLQGGFQRLFNPTPWSYGTLGTSITQVSVSSASSARAVTAQTHSDGKADLLVWNNDIANAKSTKLGGAWSKVTGATDVAVANVRNDFAATVIRSNAGIVLSGWDIDANGVPTETSSLSLSAAGSSPRIAAIGPNLFAVSYINGAGIPYITLFTVSANAPSQITNWVTSGAFLLAKEVDISGGPAVAFGNDIQVVLAVRQNGGGTVLVSYTVGFTFGYPTSLNFQTQRNEPDLTSVSLGRTGYNSSSYRLAGVDPVSKHARIFFFTASGSTLTDTGSTDYTKEQSQLTRVAGLGNSDVSAQLISLNGSGQLRVSSHDIDVLDGNPASFAPLNLLGSNEGAATVQATAMAMTPINDGGAAGTYLVVTNTSNTLVQLLIYRVAWQ